MFIGGIILVWGLALPIQAGLLADYGEAAFAGQVNIGFADLKQKAAELKITPVVEGFYRPKELPILPENFEKSLAAAVMLDSAFSTCSGVYISHQGHILTAAHCVLDVLKRASVRHEIDLDLFSHVSAVNQYGGVRTRLWTQAPQQTMLLVSGKGYLASTKHIPDVSSLLHKNEIIDELSRLASGDWVILQAQDAKTTPCLKVSEISLKEGDMLWSAGYPAWNIRHDNRGSTGKGLFVTYGEKLAGISQSGWFSRLNEKSRQVFLRVYQPGIDSSDLILTDKDSYGGMSGSLIVNQYGELAGVVTASGNTSREFLFGSTMGISIQKVFKDLRGAGLNPSDYFSCR